MAKSRAQLDREVNTILARRTSSFRVPWYITENYEGMRNPSSKIVEPWGNHRPRRQDRRDPTLPKDETFACLDRDGKILGTSKTVSGAMQKAPKGDSYALVRGEYVSTGAHYGIGKGRQMAVRERGRWQVG